MKIKMSFLVFSLWQESTYLTPWQTHSFALRMVMSVTWKSCRPVIKPSPCSCSQSHYEGENSDGKWREAETLSASSWHVRSHWRGKTFWRFPPPPLPVSYHEPQQRGLNLTPCIGRNVLCGRLPAFIRAAFGAPELCGSLLTDFIKIGIERQWAWLNLIYSISVPHMECVFFLKVC